MTSSSVLLYLRSASTSSHFYRHRYHNCHKGHNITGTLQNIKYPSKMPRNCHNRPNGPGHFNTPMSQAKIFVPTILFSSFVSNVTHKSLVPTVTIIPFRQNS